MQILVPCATCGEEKRPLVACPACGVRGDAGRETADWRRALHARSRALIEADPTPAETPIRPLRPGPRRVVVSFAEGAAAAAGLIVPSESAAPAPEARSFDWNERGVLRRLRRAA
jgi:hypothetical protein